MKQKYQGKDIDEDFRTSIWRRLAAVIAQENRTPALSVELIIVEDSGKKYVKVYDEQGYEMFTYLSQGQDQSRFLERCRESENEVIVTGRGDALRKLRQLTRTQNERLMLKQGYKTRGQVMEESFWFRAAYHNYLEFGPEGCAFQPAVEENSGAFTVTCSTFNQENFCRYVIPRQAVQPLLTTLRDYLPNQHDMVIHPIPLRSIFKVDMTTELDLEIRPQIQLIQEGGEERYYESEELERFRYGNLVYLQELGILAELEGRDSKRQFRAPKKMILKQTQVPAFLDEMADELEEGRYAVTEAIKKIQIFKKYDQFKIKIEALERDWYWLSVSYGFGNTSMSLEEILRARRDGNRYIGTSEGWIDCWAESLSGLDALLDLTVKDKSAGKAAGLKLSRMEVLRLRAAVPADPNLTGDKGQVDVLTRLLDLQPATPFTGVAGMTSSLRRYQRLGAEWLLFLFENGLGGLLCDDMGLGKTHQVMALWAYLIENDMNNGPNLLVCPTTVLSHWEAKLREHAPGLKISVYYGADRDLTGSSKTENVLLTSYGVLRRDRNLLRTISFDVAVFDEIQHIKNPDTLAYRAAQQIKARMKLGLTGTPIENSLNELKALMDLTVPGYLGTDGDFHHRYVAPLSENLDSPRREELQRLVAPFTLRRLKSTVLEELPPKIEDIRICRLSDDQIKLYRDAINTRAGDLLEMLEEGKKPVPYIHVFALLNILKQVCNHPALVKGSPEEYEQYDSGKWDLFEELMAESLDSGQKVVVYSQFLGMIQIIEKFLADLGIGYVSLTGASRNRGDIISRFNTDPDCRVFVGSLKAGGTGIDLVAASVVIHYDRWWNAAREDQATDRVHRIGQNRGVQVFKLVTEGTLEEKISAIIMKKRDLMDRVILEDDPGLLKSFSREQLLELLSYPGAAQAASE